MSLQSAFEAFASFGSGPQKDMDNSHFSKMCKESKLIDKSFTTTDADLLFNKAKPKGGRRLTYTSFQSVVLPEIAAKKKTTADAVADKIQASSPQSSGTKADAVKFHDDKSLYSGVHGHGGPSTIDRDPASLKGLVDRRVSADVRGVTQSQR